MDIRLLLSAVLVLVASQLSAAPPPEPDREPGAPHPTAEGKFPRIGETLEELTADYGPGKKNAGKIRIPGDDEYYWEMRGLGINVVMQDGKSIMLVVHQIGRKITEADIKEVRDANGEGRGWRPEGNRWISGDRRLAAFRAKNHLDMFFVEDLIPVEKSGHAIVPGGR
jgi:hypothetical protein